MDGRALVAEAYLTRLTPGDPHAGMYVRLARKYGVSFARIVKLTGFPSLRVAGFLEAGD